MISKRKSGFRFVPWRFSWKWFALIFLIFSAFNYAVVRYSSKRSLLSQQHGDIDRSTKSIQVALDQQAQDLLSLRGEIERVRITSESQRKTIQTMRNNLDTASGKLSKLSEQVDDLLNSNDELSRAAERQEQTLDRIQNALADVKMRLQQVRDGLAQPGSQP